MISVMGELFKGRHLMANNKGATLLEVIIAVVLLGIIATSSMDAFSVARKSNLIANRYMQADDLSMLILEEAHNIDFDDFIRYSEDAEDEKAYLDSTYLDPESQYCKLKIPSKYNLNGNKWVKTVSEGDSTKVTLTLNNITGRRVSFNATLTLDTSEYKDDYNETQFPVLDTITNGNTAIIDAIGSTLIYKREDGEYVHAYTDQETLKYFLSSHAATYDNKALNAFKELNKQYVRRKYDEACAAIDDFNEENETDVPYPDFDSETGEFEYGGDHYAYATDSEIKRHLKKTTTVSLSNDDLFTFLSADIQYELKQSVGGTWYNIIEDQEDSTLENANRKQTYSLNNTSKYIRLSNLYFMYVPLSSDWKTNNAWGSDIDNLVINNGIDVDDSVDINIYLVAQPIDSDGNEISGELDAVRDIFIYPPPTTTLSVADASDVQTIIYTNTSLKKTDIKKLNGGDDYEVSGLHADKTHLLNEKYSRLFAAKVEIRDATTNALYSVKESNILR